MRFLTALCSGLALSVAGLAHADALTPLQGCGAGVVQSLPAAFQPGVYVGTLGPEPVLLELGGRGGTPDRYAYARRGLDIELERGQRGGGLVLAEGQVAGLDRVARGCLDLTPVAGGLSGRWRRPDGRQQFPLRLRRVDASAAPLRLPASPGLLRLRRDDPFTFLKLNHALRPDPVRGGLNWLREPLSGLSYPRLPAGAAGNGVLQDRHLAAAVNALNCAGDLGSGADPAHPAWAQTTDLTWLSARLLSLRDQVSYFCGGAHPDASTEGLILDRRTGRELRMTDLWPRLTRAELHRRYLAAYLSAQTSAECRDVIRDDGQEALTLDRPYAAYLTARGLALWPAYLPHVVLACAEEVTLPYADLSSLAGPLAPRR